MTAGCNSTLNKRVNTAGWNSSFYKGSSGSGDLKKSLIGTLIFRCKNTIFAIAFENRLQKLLFLTFFRGHFFAK